MAPQSLDPKKAEDLKAVFCQMSQSGDGFLEVSRFTKFMQKSNPQMTDLECQEVFKHVDQECKGSVGFEQLVAWCFPDEKKPVFFDMIHSNNAARIRIWLKKKGLQNAIDTKMVTYPDLQSEEFKAVNPLKKVPAFITGDGTTVFESDVIMGFLEDKYGSIGPSFSMPTAEGRAKTQLIVRVHDLYIASPNCTQPGFSHTQGSMYLAPYETKWCRADRAMDKATRAAKLAEIWKQLTWLEENIIGPCMAGDQVTVADMTWYPTCIFMEFMLPKVFGWPEVFHESEHFPKLTEWFGKMSADPVFRETRQDIWDYWVTKEAEGQFESIRGELTDTDFKWKYP